MNWRCGERSGALRCMFAPGHKDDHGAVVTINGRQGMFFWAREATVDELVAEVYPEAKIVQEMAPPVELPPSGNQPEIYAGRADLDGRRRRRVHQYNVYVAFDEGMPSAVHWTGMEIPRMPMQDEIKWASA